MLKDLFYSSRTLPGPDLCRTNLLSEKALYLAVLGTQSTLSWCPSCDRHHQSDVWQIWISNLCIWSCSWLLQHWNHWKIYPQAHIKISLTVKALVHYTKNFEKCSYFPYTLTTFCHNCNNFSTVLCMGHYFGNNFYQKIFAVSCVVLVCRGLYATFYAVNSKKVSRSKKSFSGFWIMLFC